MGDGMRRWRARFCVTLRNKMLRVLVRLASGQVLPRLPAGEAYSLLSTNDLSTAPGVPPRAGLRAPAPPPPPGL